MTDKVDRLSQEELDLVVKHREQLEVASRPPFWTCSGCGFSNKPHAFRLDNTKCEQCGKKRDKNDREA